MFNVPKRQAQRPDQWLQSAPSLGACHRVTLSHTLSLAPPATTSIHSCSLVTHHGVADIIAHAQVVVHLKSHQPGLLVTQGDIYRVTYTVTPLASPLLQFHVPKPSLTQLLH